MPNKRSDVWHISGDRETKIKPCNTQTRCNSKPGFWKSLLMNKHCIHHTELTVTTFYSKCCHCEMQFAFVDGGL